ncbi:MAG: hypothetical protein AAB391_01410 [Patescibacteria group bacterium]
MVKALILSWQYLQWHYSRAFAEMFRIIGRAYWFEYHFFSVGILLRSFFEPWKRLGEEKGEKFKLEQWLQATVINTLMRLIGVTLRAMILMFALAVCVLTTLVVALFVAMWCLLPFIILALFVRGVQLAIQ